MKKLEYFFFEEEKKRAAAEEEAEAIPIDQLMPFIPFDFDGFVMIERKQLQITPEFYYECQFEEEGELQTVIISDGTRYLPPKIAELVLQNDWFCLAARQINANAPYNEEITIVINYGDIARLHFADMVHPAGVCSEIFASINEDCSSYVCSYNNHPLIIGNDDEYECKATASTKRLNAIDFIDARGIDYLAQCLKFRVSHMSDT